MVKNDPTAYIVFPVHNRIEETKVFLASCRLQTSKHFKIVICDDGSTDGTSEYIKKNYPEVILVHGDGNLWWSAGINKCIEYVLDIAETNDYIITLNNDTQIPPEYIEQKLNRASNYKNSIIGSLCVYSNNHNTIETSGYIMDFDACMVRHLNKSGETRNASHRGMVKATHMPGKGVLLPIQVFSDVGLYDADNFPQYHADTDLVLKAHKKGYSVYVDYDSTVYSVVNENIMAIPTNKITLTGIIKSFGPYSINNFSVYNNFSKIHFPKNRIKFLFKTYFMTIGGMTKRYFKQMLQLK